MRLRLRLFTMVYRPSKSWGQAQSWQPSASWTQTNYGNNQQQWRGDGSPNQDDHLDQQPAARGGTARELQEQLGDARAGRPPFSDASDQPPVTQVQQAPGLPLTTSAGAAYTKDTTFMVFSDDDIDPADKPRPSAGAASTMPSDHATAVPIAAAQA